MSEIIQRAWHEPAVLIGLLTSIALTAITITTGDPWDAAAIAAVIAPLAAALGTRPLVTPVTNSETEHPPEDR